MKLAGDAMVPGRETVERSWLLLERDRF